MHGGSRQWRAHSSVTEKSETSADGSLLRRGEGDSLSFFLPFRSQHGGMIGAHQPVVRLTHGFAVLFRRLGYFFLWFFFFCCPSFFRSFGLTRWLPISSQIFFHTPRYTESIFRIVEGGPCPTPWHFGECRKPPRFSRDAALQRLCCWSFTASRISFSSWRGDGGESGGGDAASAAEFVWMLSV